MALHLQQSAHDSMTDDQLSRLIVPESHPKPAPPPRPQQRESEPDNPRQSQKGHIDFMPHRRHDRHPGLDNGTNDHFFVECPQIL